MSVKNSLQVDQLQFRITTTIGISSVNGTSLILVVTTTFICSSNSILTTRIFSRRRANVGLHCKIPPKP